MIGLSEIDQSWMTPALRAGSSPGPICRQPAVPVDARRQTDAVPRWAWGALALFFAMNLLDSADQWLLAAVLLQPSATISSSPRLRRAGYRRYCCWRLAAASLPVGYLADRLRRPRLLAMGFAIWSVATVATGLARSYDQIQIARALVGIGGATFEIAALTILMDVFPRGGQSTCARGLFPGGPSGCGTGIDCRRGLCSRDNLANGLPRGGCPGIAACALVALVLPDPVRGASEAGRPRAAAVCTNASGPARKITST